VDRALRELLIAHRLPWAVVSGQGEARLENAVAALAPLLRPRNVSNPGPGQGLFTRLQTRHAPSARQRWACDCCKAP